MNNSLRERPPKHGELKALAARIGISVRTLYAWRRDGRGGRPGRRPRVQVDRAQARSWIEPRWKDLASGHNGVRTTRVMLSQDNLHIPVAIVQAIVRELKQERALRDKERREAARVSVDVLASDAVWSLDQMDFGRDEHGSVRALAASDACSQRILDATVGPPATGRDVVALLERAAAEREGNYPFVLQVDNGSENQNEVVHAWAALHEVVLLFNLPHTPEHNPRAEHTNGSLRVASGLDKPTLRRVGGLRELLRVVAGDIKPVRRLIALMLARAWNALDVCTPRASLGDLTPCELDRNALRAEDRACRARFYREVCEELESIARLPIGKRARRKQSREAIWCALERHGLVKRTRGGLPVRAFKSEGIT